MSSIVNRPEIPRLASLPLLVKAYDLGLVDANVSGVCAGSCLRAAVGLPHISFLQISLRAFVCAAAPNQCIRPYALLACAVASLLYLVACNGRW